MAAKESSPANITQADIVSNEDKGKTVSIVNGIVELSISILEIRYLDTLPKPPPINTKNAFLRKYAKLVSSASIGAVTSGD